MKYFYFFDVLQDAYIIRDYDPQAQGLRIIHNTALLYHDTITANADQIKDSLQACINALDGTKHPILYNGQDVNPLQRDIFLTWHNGEIYETYSRRAQA